MGSMSLGFSLKLIIPRLKVVTGSTVSLIPCTRVVSRSSPSEGKVLDAVSLSEELRRPSNRDSSAMYIHDNAS